MSELKITSYTTKSYRQKQLAKVVPPKRNSSNDVSFEIYSFCKKVKGHIFGRTARYLYMSKNIVLDGSECGEVYIRTDGLKHSSKQLKKMIEKCFELYHNITVASYKTHLKKDVFFFQINSKNIFDDIKFSIIICNDSYKCILTNVDLLTLHPIDNQKWILQASKTHKFALDEIIDDIKNKEYYFLNPPNYFDYYQYIVDNFGTKKAKTMYIYHTMQRQIISMYADNKWECLNNYNDIGYDKIMCRNQKILEKMFKK